MITVTSTACAALAELLDDGGVSPHLVLRVVTDGDGNFDLSLESPHLEDTIFNYRGRNVLAVEPQAAHILAGTSLDF